MDITRYELNFPASTADIIFMQENTNCDADCKHYQAVVQLVHGMAEYILRYEDFAVYIFKDEDM